MGKNMYTSSLEMLLNDIGKYRVLNRNEEVILTNKAKLGDKAAREKLINHNMRFVVKESKKFLNKGLDLEDLIIEGCIGLNDALTKFDVSKGVRFITFAVYRINLAIRKAIREQGHSIRLPDEKSLMLGRIYQALDLIGGNINDSMVQEKIAKYCNISITSLQKILSISDESFSLNDKVLVGNSFMEFSDLVCDEKIVSPEVKAINSTLKTEVHKILKKLPVREANVICLKYGLTNENTLSLQKIGDKMNLSKERVRQLKECAFERLRENWCRDKIECFLFA